MTEANISQIYGLTGLTESEVIARRAAGQGNNVKLQTSRSYKQIIQENLFTFINWIFFAISAVFFLLGRIGDSILVVVVILGGILINIYQEIWAKRKLDEIALLNRPKATVIREGREKNIDPGEIVLGDILLVRPGDQIVVDGAVVGEGRMEVDESLLTGESDMILKFAGQSVFSGSFCVSGSACCEVQKVGADTLAYQLTIGARAFRQVLTPLQREINVVIRVFMLISCFLWILVSISFLSRSYSLSDLLQRAAVIAGLVPAGLLLAITLAYGLGAVKMIGQNVLIQQANAVESLSNVDVLCLDKTGTLTTNQISLETIYPLNINEAELRSLLGDFAATTKVGNKTSDAIGLACPGTARSLIAEVPFSSSRKWSAIAFDDPLKPGIYILGAPEVLTKNIDLTPEITEYIAVQTNKGLRVVLFAYSPDLAVVKDWHDQTNNQPTEVELPTYLVPLAILIFSDKLRPEAYETIQGFAKAGIAIKIISGDHPQTVAALAKQAGLGSDLAVVSGQELAQLSPIEFTQTAKNSTIFGRITPEQKARLVESLRKTGHYVAMIGDGVNDVLSLKRANLAIAMESGSKATRGIADIVLLKDSFAALPYTFLEGQRIRNGIFDILKLFLVRVFCVTLLIFATAIVTDSFPLENKQSALVSLIGVGLPTICIPIWAKPGILPRRSMVQSMLHFTIPATITITLTALLVYLYYLVWAVLDLPPGADISQVDYSIPRSALATILILCQLFLILFLKPPTSAWVGGERLSGDWRYTITAGVLLLVYIVIISVPPLRRFFELWHFGIQDYLFMGLVAIEWCLVVRFMWRTRFLDKFLGIDLY